ncbi:hypothetical protein HPP92_006628 [Vanilla planifolia]|uniref:Calmodulin-binding protein n=1 Tax=Vanilla planifolia TaxID=51239 RepID=A0A835RK90_VANPL|nr:hypothetical protein HPP92_006628 [Vanilla planifolia]
MGHESHGNGETHTATAELEDGCSGEAVNQSHDDIFADEIDSTSSTPFVSAPSSPGRGISYGAYFFSAPASPMHYVLCNPPHSVTSPSTTMQNDASVTGSFEFEFSAKYATIASSSNAGSMTSADELFLNGQIRPMKLSSHLECPQSLAPLVDVCDESAEIADPDERGRDLKMRSRSIHRRTRSMSPMRKARFQWQEEDEVEKDAVKGNQETEQDKGAEGLLPSESASSSRSSSSGRNSKRWVFLKDLLYRSKSEGRANTKEKFWHSISFSPSKDKSKPSPTASSFSSPSPTPPQNLCSEPSEAQSKKNGSGSSSARTKKTGSSSSTTSPKPPNGTGKRRSSAPSPHERFYTANRAQMEEMRRRTFLPYRQGLLGCLGFSSRGYGAINGFAKSLNPVSSR